MVTPVDTGQLGIGKSADLKADSEADSGLRTSIREAIQVLKLAWETIENVCSISRTVSVSEYQCARIADHFRDVGKILQDLGLDKALDGRGRSEERFWDIAKPIDMIVIDILKKKNLRASDSDPLLGDALDSFYVLRFIGAEGRHLKLLIDMLFEELLKGQELISIHQGLKEVNNEVVEQTGLYGEKIMPFHQRLTHLLFLFDIFHRTPYSPEYKLKSSISNLYYTSYAVERHRMLIYYLNSNCLGTSPDVFIKFNTNLNLELAEALVKMSERPDSVLKGLVIDDESFDVSSFYHYEIELGLEIGDKSSVGIDHRSDQQKEEVSKCRSRVIGALGRSSKLTCFTMYATTEADVRELSKSVAANRVLEELNLRFPTALGDHDADILSATLKKNQSVKTFRLLTAGISPEGAVSFAAMLAENSTLEELDVSGNSLGGVGVKNLLRPLMANKDGELPANTSLKRLHIGRNKIGKQTGGASAIAQTLCTNKTLTHFSMQNEHLGADRAREILKSLEVNKTLKELDISGCSDFNGDVSMVFMDLLVKYNFTLRVINFYYVEDFITCVLKPAVIQQRRYLISSLTPHSTAVGMVDNQGQNVDNLKQCILQARSEADFRDEITQLYRKFSEKDVYYLQLNGLDTKQYEALIEYLFVEVSKIYNHKLPRKVDQELGYQRTLERHSKASLQKLNSFLENEPQLENNYFLQRGLNMAESLPWDIFEKMCSYRKWQKNDVIERYGRGRTTAALFPNTFLFHFKALTIDFGIPYFDHDKKYLSLFLLAANMVAKSWKDLCGHEQQSFYIDVDAGIDVGCILPPGGIVALCKNFQEGKEDGDPQANISRQYGIGQDDITGVYFCGRFETSALEETIHNEAIGVIGVKLTSTSIEVQDMSEDGSYYAGELEDFSYNFGLDKNNGDPLHKQCAAKAFGDLEGASFLRKQNHGIKCSPLLLIALASASQRKGLNINWNDNYGHIEIDLKPACSQALESVQCQILFTSKIKELGLAVVWGMDPMALDPQSSGASTYCNQAQKTGAVVDKGKRQIAQDSQTSDTCESNSITRQEWTAMYQATLQDTKKFSAAANAIGSGGSVSFEIMDSKAKELKIQTQRKLSECVWKEKGGYVERIALDEKHKAIETYLTQGSLSAAKPNYLVVQDNIRKSHVSIYCVNEGQGESELEWITDTFLEGGPEQCEEIFKRGLKGRDLTITRDSTTFKSIIPAANKVTGFFSTFIKSKTNTLEKNMVELPEFGSNNEWEHLIGPQTGFSGNNKFWWQASFTQAILCSRTRFSTGGILTTGTSLERGHSIGHCKSEGLEIENPERKYVHKTYNVKARGKFSRAPASQGDLKVYNWGGLLIENLR